MQFLRDSEYIEPQQYEYLRLNFLRASYVRGNEWENVDAGTSNGELIKAEAKAP